MLVSIGTRTTGLGLIVAYGLIFCSIILASHSQIVPVLAPTGAAIFKTFYHVLPNFAEVVAIQAQLIDGDPVANPYPLISSLIFGACVHGLGFLWFGKRDF